MKDSNFWTPRKIESLCDGNANFDVKYDTVNTNIRICVIIASNSTINDIFPPDPSNINPNFLCDNTMINH